LILILETKEAIN